MSLGITPTIAASFSSMPWTSTLDPARAGVRSSVSIAAIAPPVESPTNSTPSGPNVSAPADLSPALPVAINATAEAGVRTA